MRYERNMNLTADIVSRLTVIAAAKKEHLMCFSLDSALRVTNIHQVFVGTLNQVESHPREIFCEAISDHAAKIVIAHNHPYGEPQPSPGDIEVTQRLISCGRIIGIPLIDHIVVAGKKHFSFSKHGLMDDFDGERIVEYLS
jgi:DNA repair protein RadC